MNHRENKYYYVLLWLTPTAVETAIYILISLMTLFLSSQDFIKDLLFATGDFNPIRTAIASIDALLQKMVGERVAGSLSLAIFWGTVGLIVNLIWWVASNFSTELNNDLVFSKYVHPKDSDPKSQLREFIQRTVIRTSVAVVGIVYTNYVLSQAMPRITELYREILQTWSISAQWKDLIITLSAQIFILHIFVVLTRLILLRKRVFDR